MSFYDDLLKHKGIVLGWVSGSGVSNTNGDLISHVRADAQSGHGVLGVHLHTNPASGGQLNHGSLSNLLLDDHTQYASANGAGARSAYSAERLNRAINTGNGLTGGGTLVSDLSFAVSITNGLQFAAGAIGVNIGNGLDLAGGKVNLTTPGSLSVSSANSSAANHTHAVTASADPAAAETLLKSSAAGKLTLRGLTLRGDLMPIAPDAVNIGSSTYPFLTGHVSELYGTRFVEETIQVAGGHWLIPKSSATLAADLTSGAASLTVGASQAWAVGDYLVMRDIGQVEYMRVTGGSGATWSVTRNMDGSGANAWVTGATVVNLGQQGDGYIEAVGGSQFGLSLWQRTGTNYADVSEIARLGNLRDWNGYPSSDIAGFGFGDADRWISFDRTSGLRINSPLIVGSNLGFTTDALLYCAFEGPQPYAREFGGSAVGHSGQTPVVSGPVIFRPGKFGKGAQLARATTNLVTNPSFEIGTSDWTGVSGSGGTGSYNVAGEAASYGLYSLRVLKTNTTGFYYVTHSVGVTAGNTYSFGVDLKSAGAAVGSTVTAYVSTHDAAYTSSTNFTAASAVALATLTAWERYVGTFTVPSGHTAADIIILLGGTATGRVYIDGVQLEPGGTSTPYCDGSLGPGHTWSGMPRNSTSTRSANSGLRYAFPVLFDVGHIHWWGEIHPPDSGVHHHIYVAGAGGNINLYQIQPSGLLVARWGSATWSDTTVLTPGLHMFDLTNNGTTAKLYVDGALRASFDGTGLGATTEYLYVGANNTTINNLDGVIDDLMVRDVVPTAADIKSIYDSGAPLNIRSGPFDLYLSGGSSNGWLLGNGDGLAGYSADGTKQAWFGSDGRFYAGGGSVAMNSEGISINQGTVRANQLYWTQPGTSAYFGGLAMQLINPGISQFLVFSDVESVMMALDVDNGMHVFGDIVCTGGFRMGPGFAQGPGDMGGAPAATLADLQAKLSALRTILFNFGLLSN